jgi:hypothetical protein
MNKDILLASARAAIKLVPDAYPLLSLPHRRALAEPSEYKTYEFFLSAVQGLVNGVYMGLVDSDFVFAMDNLISGQLTDAYTRAWMEDGHVTELPDYLQGPLDAMIAEQQSHVVDFWHAIIDARVDETSIAPLLNRAAMWAGRWVEAFEMAQHLIAVQNGGKEVWVMDAGKENCTICSRLNGIVAYASEWDALNVHPRNAPNPILSKDRGGCGGWRCGCSRRATDKRRSPKAFDTILNIIGGG